ncbi:Transmembrane Fragile-X-F-associated protein [Cinara cedri]|uniref:Transmembrane Fragile-X-F-associated protein n=1 Tax=Cinara cedri TaxID=506608 RepID=A0A5E4MVX3_9HEMI|nr:Transmembrane Fragile-X-F-associated protein [Cinara cedri]
MPLTQRALTTWASMVVFLVLLTIQLQSKQKQSWYTIFMPIWMDDALTALFIICSCVHSNSCHAISEMPVFCGSRRCIIFIICLMKIIAQLTLCHKLENKSPQLPMVYVFLPIWTLIIYLIIIVVPPLIRHYKE